MADIAFIDLEASGLSAQSWPIEVGWCLPKASPRAFLIRPEDDWPMTAWDRQAENLHRIAHQTLMEKGDAPQMICATLNEALDGRIVYSDAPDWDGFWLYRLYQAAGVRQQFSLTDFNMILNGFPPEVLEGLVAEASRIAPHRHRAEDDVLHMRALHQLAARQG